jgi:hypothetical protein
MYYFRQGGVLSVLMYATVMDEIDLKNQEYQQTTKKTIKQDDVVISDNLQELQQMLDITYEIASRYRIVFGKATNKHT